MTTTRHDLLKDRICERVDQEVDWCNCEDEEHECGC